MLWDVMDSQSAMDMRNSHGEEDPVIDLKVDDIRTGGDEEQPKQVPGAPLLHQRPFAQSCEQRQLQNDKRYFARANTHSYAWDAACDGDDTHNPLPASQPRLDP